MFEFKNKSKEIHLEKGKEIFFKYYGSSCGIGREAGPDYDACNIPKEVEKEWLLEIKESLKNEIENSTGIAKIHCIGRLLDINGHHDNLILVSRILKESKLDTFSEIMLCEYLLSERKHIQDSVSYDKKKYEQNRPLIAEINTIVRNYAQKILSQSITIDESYKNASYMQNYDFSDANIRKRIEELTKKYN